jgi:hypothetical protein
MKIISYSLFALILSFCFISPNREVSAQTTISGTWKAEEPNWNRKEKKRNEDDNDAINELQKGEIQLSFRYRQDSGTNNQGSTFNFSDFEGLTKAQTIGSNVAVNFRLVREAGNVACEGKFNAGKGEGTFRFTPNINFTSTMQSRGFEFSGENLFSATFLNLTVAFVDDIKSAGFKNLEVEDLFKAKIFKIDSVYMREMAATGFLNLDMEDLVKARIFKIDAKFVKEVIEMGFAKDSLEDLVKLRIFKITPEYLREMKSLGFLNLSAEEATKFRIFKVTPGFVNKMKAEGLANLTVEEVVKLRIFNVTGEFVRRARAKSSNMDVEDIVNLKIRGRN